MKVDEFIDNLPAYFDKTSNPIEVFEVIDYFADTQLITYDRQWAIGSSDIHGIEYYEDTICMMREGAPRFIDIIDISGVAVRSVNLTNTVYALFVYKDEIFIYAWDIAGATNSDDIYIEVYDYVTLVFKRRWFTGVQGYAGARIVVYKDEVYTQYNAYASTYLKVFDLNGNLQREFNLFPMISMDFGVNNGKIYTLTTTESLDYVKEYGYLTGALLNSFSISSVPQGSKLKVSSFNIFVTAVGNVRCYDFVGNLEYNVGTSGTGDGEFTSVGRITLSNFEIYVIDSATDRIQVFKGDLQEVLSVVVDVDKRTFTVKKTIDEYILDINDMVIEDIVMHLRNKGYIVNTTSSVYDQLYWFVLVSQQTTGKVYYESSLLKRFYGAIAQFWIDNIKAYDDALIESYFYQAHEHWLDLWGKYFGHLRRTNETDVNYFRRIIHETLILKTNNKTLMKLVKEASEYFVDVKDLGVGAVGIFYTNHPVSTTNNADDILFNNLIHTFVRNNAFGVYIYAGNINNLSTYDKSVIVGVVEKYRSGGNHPIYFAPVGHLNTNVAGENTNDAGYVVAPDPKSWTEITV